MARPARGQPRRRPGRDSGALTLGYVVVFPAFLVAIMTIVQISQWYLANEAALAAARQGANAARQLGAAPGAGPAAALAFARQAGSGYLLNPATSSRGSTRTTIQIRVTGSVPSFVPGLSIGVSQVAQAPVEQFTTP